MRCIAVSTSAAALILAAPLLAAPANPGTQCVETEANAEAFRLGRQIVEIMIPAESGEAMMQQMMGSLVTQMRNGMGPELDDPGAQKILDNHMKRMPEFFRPFLAKYIPLQKQAMACAYTHEFSVEELRDIASFASSPSGKRYLSRSVALMSDPAIARSNEAFFKELQEPSKKFQEELINEMSAYFQSKEAKKQ
jgi:hypothetical protein